MQANRRGGLPVRVRGRHGAMLVLYAGLMACQPDSGDPEAARAEAAAQARFESARERWRDERREALLAPDGWASLVGLHWLERGATHRVGSGPANGVRLAVGPASLGVMHVEAGGVRLVPAEGVQLTLDDAPLEGPVVLRSDADAAGPSRIGFDEGLGQATVIERGDRLALRVRHAAAPTRSRFAGLEYWPGGREWQVEARFDPNPDGHTMPVANIIGGLEAMPNPGAVVFEHGGQPHRIEALDEGDGTLFLIFADRTSGHGSYPAGRYLKAQKPDATGRLVLDFNRAYNPPCAFTDFATCPLPPPENRLDLAIEAGEKAYRKPGA
jgi:uncharacterized protein (DUF1684 family)